MNKEVINVLSLFDGSSNGHLALNRALKDTNKEVGKYFASEIEENAIKVTLDNFPSTIQIGDIRKVSYKYGILTTENGSYEVDIDIVMGGSPCQTVSLANRGGGKINDGKSSLFWEYERILREVNPKWFLLENVPMSESNKNIISKALGVDCMIINSNLVSIQNRKRLYWTNIKGVKQPEDRGILLKDNYCKEYDEDLILKGRGLNKLDRPRNRMLDINSDKCPTLLKTQESKATDSIIFNHGDIFRYPTRRECEMMQNLPEGYTDSVKYNSAVGICGNGWTVDVIVYIFSFLPFYKYANK